MSKIDTSPAALRALADRPLVISAAADALRAVADEKESDPWLPIETIQCGWDVINIKLVDGSVLCGCLLQSDGDIWWRGSGAGERFVDQSICTGWKPGREASHAAAETLARVRSGEERTVPLEEAAQREAALERLTRIDEEIEAAAPQPPAPQPPERGFCPELAKRVGFGEGSDAFWALVEQKRKATGGDHG